MPPPEETFVNFAYAITIRRTPWRSNATVAVCGRLTTALDFQDRATPEGGVADPIRRADAEARTSKSLGNYVGINEPSREVYGKLLSITDELMFKYYELLTDLTLEDIRQLRLDIQDGRRHPKRVKQDLALL